MRYLNFLVLLTLISCGHSGETRRNLEESGSYQTSGAEQFFLPELPSWANASQAGKCFKSGSFHYLDFKKIAASYKLNYGQAMEVQAQYNDRIESYYRSTTVKFLKPVEEASFFSNALEQVRGGVNQLNLPQGVNEVEIYWLEGLKNQEIKKLQNSGRLDQRLPILFSSCLSRQNLTQWVTTEGLDQAGFYLISAEWLSPYNSNLELTAGLRLEIKKVLPPTMKIHFYKPVSPEIIVQ